MKLNIENLDAAAGVAWRRDLELRALEAAARDKKSAVLERKAGAAREMARAKALSKAAEEKAFKGEGAADKQKLRERYNAAEMEFEAADHLIPQANAEIATRVAAVTEHRAARDIAMSAAFSAREREACAAAMAKLAELGGPISELVGIARIRRELIGDRFAFDPQQGIPVGGEQVARALVEAIPPALAIPAFTLSEIGKSANEVASRIAAEIGVETRESELI